MRTELLTDNFYESDVEHNYGDTYKINTLAQYKDRLYAGCDDGLVIVFTNCVKCYKLKKACDFDIKTMTITDGNMEVSDGEQSKTISMSALGGDTIEADEAYALISNGAVLIDVRTAAEFAEKSVDGSVNIPVDEIEDGLKNYDTDTSLIFFCVSGTRAQKAVETAKKLGFDKVYNLGSIDKLM
jgi:phage shock protein E